MKTKWGIGAKIAGGFGFVMVLLTLVMGIYHYEITRTTTSFRNLMNEEIAITNHSDKITALTLQCRRNEKDFLMRREEKYVDSLKKNIADLKEHSQAVIALGSQYNYPSAVEKATAIGRFIEAYDSAFQGVVAAWKVRGLDHTSGLQGEFRNAAHKLETILKEHDVEDLYIALLQMRRYEKDFIHTQENDYKSKFLKAMSDYETLLDKSACAENEKNAQKKALNAYKVAFQALLKAGSGADQEEKAMRAAAREMETAIGNVHVPNAGKLLLTIRRNEKDYLLRNDKEYVTKTHAAAAVLLEAFRTSGVLAEHVRETENVLNSYQKAFDDLVGENAEIDGLMEKMRSAAHQVEPLVEALHKESEDKGDAKIIATTENAVRNGGIALVLGVGAVVLGGLLAFFITRGITRALKQIIDNLYEGSEQVSAASMQVSTSSQSLAEGASQQAAAIEESSSSLEEMSSMTKQNAANADQANVLMAETSNVVKAANDSMARLTDSMKAISKASEETSKIIKTIDEIAFQTNLLALNAAVEAARAGEAGAGFAVVADEVRNLAMRASEAAKNTANLIEGTVKKVKDGSELVGRTNEAFQQVAESNIKVGQLISEIAASSGEQAQGIEQINKSVTEMDKVTQQNAANAEESASASEEMNAQAGQMKNMVDELVAMMGRAAQSGTRRVEHAERGIIPDRTRQTGKTELRIRPVKSALVQIPKEIRRPEEVIPMEDDFKDF